MLSKWNGCRLLVEGKLLILYTCQLRTVGEDHLFQNVLSGMPQYCTDCEITLLLLLYVDTVCCVISCCSIFSTRMYCSVQVCIVPFLILVHLQKLGICVKVCFKVGNDGAEAFEMLVTSFWGADSGKGSSSWAIAEFRCGVKGVEHSAFYRQGKK